MSRRHGLAFIAWASISFGGGALATLPDVGPPSAIEPRAADVQRFAGNTSSNTSSNTSNNSSSDGPWRRDRIIREEQRDFHTDRGGYSSGYRLDYDSGTYWQDDRRRRGPRARHDRD